MLIAIFLGIYRCKKRQKGKYNGKWYEDKKLALACSVLSIGLVFNVPAKAESVTIYAAASLTNAINDLEKFMKNKIK